MVAVSAVGLPMPQRFSVGHNELRWPMSLQVPQSEPMFRFVSSAVKHVSGIGEVIEPMPIERRHITLIIPPLHVSTPLVYKAWDALGHLQADGPNDLEPAALAVEPQLVTWRDRIIEATGQIPTLAGSGSTWFITDLAASVGQGLREALPEAQVVETRTGQ